MACLQFYKSLFNNTSIGGDLTSDIIDLSSVQGFYLLIDLYSAPDLVATIGYQLSNDGINWVNESTSNISSNTIQMQVDHPTSAAIYLRVFCTYTSGSGAWNVTLSGKNIYGS
jgi:hypothetical protein